jgi:hypothetical protein
MNHLLGLYLDALGFQLVGFTSMASTTPFPSITSLLGVALASSLLIPLAVRHEWMNSESTSSAKFEPTGETPRGAYDFVNSIGVNTHLNYFDRIYGNFPLVERELKSVGILHLRDGVHLQNSDYNATLYGRWIQLGNLGIRFDAVLDPRSNLGPLTGALLDEVDTLAGHSIESFEGPNEMDVSNENEWPSVDRSYQSEIFAAVNSMKSANSVRIIGPSLAFASNSFKVGEISSTFDDGNLHPYPAGQMPSVVFPDQIDLEKIMCESKPIIFTESGYHNAINEHNDQPGVSEAAAARYIPRLFLEDYARGVDRTYLYELMDEAPDPGLTNPQFHWGLIRADGSEKPAFFALKNLIAELNDSTRTTNMQPLAWSLNSKDSHILHLLLRKSDGTYDLVFWQEVSSYDLQRHADIHNPSVAATLTLGRQARNITLFQPVTQAAPIGSWKDVKSVLLEIPDHPLVVQISF